MQFQYRVRKKSVHSQKPQTQQVPSTQAQAPVQAQTQTQKETMKLNLETPITTKQPVKTPQPPVQRPTVTKQNPPKRRISVIQNIPIVSTVDTHEPLDTPDIQSAKTNRRYQNENPQANVSAKTSIRRTTT